MSYRVRLDVFEGPFDLLVYLIEHARMSIYDIQISEIVEQYLKYVEEMASFDIAVSSEFMVLAAELMEIKSRMLLPRYTPEGEEAGEQEDPRTQLVARILEYKKYKAVSEMLEEQMEKASMALEKPQEDLSVFTGEPDVYLSLGTEQFVRAFEQFLTRKQRVEELKHHHRRTEKQRLTTELRIAGITEFFRETGIKETDFRRLIARREDKYDVAVTFASVLEMMKQNKLDAHQRQLFGDIKVTAKEALWQAENQ